MKFQLAVRTPQTQAGQEKALGGNTAAGLCAGTPGAVSPQLAPAFLMPLGGALGLGGLQVLYLPIREYRLDALRKSMR